MLSILSKAPSYVSPLLLNSSAPILGSTMQVRFTQVYRKVDKKKKQRMAPIETPSYLLGKKEYPATSVRDLKQKKLDAKKKIPEVKPLRFTQQDVTPPENHHWEQAVGNTNGLPFQFSRTISNHLPVYRDYRHSQAGKVYTIVRKYVGSSKELSEELSRLIPGVSIKERAGSIELEGDHTKTVRDWLVKLGF